MEFVSVLLDVSIQKPLDYAVPQPLIGKISRGSLVKVPLRGSFRYGTVLEIKSNSPFQSAKPVAELVHPEPIFDFQLFELSLFISEYYCTPLEEVFKLFVPSSIRGKARPKEQLFVKFKKNREELIHQCQMLRLKSPMQAAILDIILEQKNGLFLTDLLQLSGSNRQSLQALVKKELLQTESVRVNRSPFVDEEYFITKAKKLTNEQESAYTKIENSLVNNRFETHLLFGVTGSGKTEVYLQAIQKALDLGKSAIMLVPEISLTTQTIERFRSRFQDNVAVLHSRLSHGERHDEWMKVVNGEVKILIGARSCVFSPLKNLGLIIVDEEHDNSYKQSESMPCYHARDVAIMRGKLAKATVILGSATPSLETYHNCFLGKYHLSTLKKRTAQSELPTLKVIDMRKEFEKAKGYTIFSEKLLEALEKRLTAGEQSILFLNRRGYHTTLSCPACGKSVQCPHCDLSLTFHLGENSLSCHLCGHEKKPPPTLCPSCQSAAPLKFKGIGTELVEKALYAIFKEVRILRLDRDTTKLKGSHEKHFRHFKSGKADILIGTQMIAKGLDFPNVTFVGILNCDGSLNIPDFRSSEFTFQLITQVAGRAGRGLLPGEVILQTTISENSTIQHAANQDFESFFAEEIELRRIFDYPPFSKLAKLRFTGKDIEATRQNAQKVRETLITLLPKNYEITPLIPSGHAKIKDTYRFQFLIRGPQLKPITLCINKILKKNKRCCFIDINPISTFF